jgi:hypothetical protein
MGLTLREGDREYYYQKLDQHFPGLKDKYQRKYGLNYELGSDNNQELMRLFNETCTRHNMNGNRDELFAYLHSIDEVNPPQQLDLFEGA